MITVQELIEPRRFRVSGALDVAAVVNARGIPRLLEPHPRIPGALAHEVKVDERGSAEDCDWLVTVGYRTEPVTTLGAA
jgi:hypothetical protein